MSGERFQSETGPSIDNCCVFFGSTSPLFYTVNPRSGISLRQQEQLGAPSILKSFRDLPGCTRLSSSLTNLDSKRTQFPLLPDIHQKGTMGKSLPGHHSTKRFVRERYNPPFKVNAKIRHVYTQEVTTIEDQGQRSQSVTHRQTQTEPELLQPEVNDEDTDTDQVGQILSRDDDDYAFPSTSRSERSEVEQQLSLTSCPVPARVDVSTSPIPLEELPLSKELGGSYPFTGCSQTSVYPPLNYVRKLEDLEKITGHIVIQRFFTRTDDAFGSWLEKQLGMTSKSVSVDTSEFENVTTAEIQDDKDEQGDNDRQMRMEISESVNEPDEINENDATSEQLEAGEDKEVKEAAILGLITTLGEGPPQQTGQEASTDVVECDLEDPVKCECYLEELDLEAEYARLEEIEEQIQSVVLAEETSEVIPPAGDSKDDEIETLLNSTAGNEEPNPPEEGAKQPEDIDEVVRCTLEAYLLAPTPYDEGDEGHFLRDEVGGGSVASLVKSEVDSGRADSIQSQEKTVLDGLDEVEGNTSHDSVETVYEMPIPSRSKELIQSLEDDKLDIEENGNHVRFLQRTLSADSCIGTESSGETNKNLHNESQSSNDIEGLDGIPSTAESAELKHLVDISLGSTSAIVSTLAKKSHSAKTVTLARCIESASAKSQKSTTFEDEVHGASVTSSPSVPRDGKTDAEDADASESESEISEHQQFMKKTKHASSLLLHQDDVRLQGTDLELEEVEEFDGEEEDVRDAFDTMVANHLKYSRGLPTSTIGGSRRRLHRGTQTTKSIEPSTSGGSSLSPCSSSNSSFDVEIISKSKRITTAATTSSAGGVGTAYHHLNKHHEEDSQVDPITPNNMTMAWHEGGRRRSYLPSSSSSLNLLNMKFSLGKDFESEVSIRVPSKSSTNPITLPPPPSGKTLMSTSSSCRAQHYYHNHTNRGGGGVSSSSYQSHSVHHPHPSSSNLPSASTLPPVEEPTELQSLWKDVRTKLDVHVDEMASTTIHEGEDHTVTSEGLHVRGSGILSSENLCPTPPTSGGNSVVKLRRHEDRIKRSLQRLKKILDD